MPPGTYTATITRPDFKTHQIDNVTVNSFQQVSLGQITLELAVGATETTEVSAERPVLDLDSGVRTETIQSQQVQDMPLQGRNWSTLLKIIPGSTPTNSEAINGREYSASGYADFRVNGKNPGQTQVNLDGGSLVDHGSDGKTTVAPSLESIQEVSVLTNNFQAEYGNRGGSVINIVTKSGTNTAARRGVRLPAQRSAERHRLENTFLGTPKPTNRFNYFGGNSAARSSRTSCSTSTTSRTSNRICRPARCRDAFPPSSNGAATSRRRSTPMARGPSSTCRARSSPAIPCSSRTT